MPIAPNIFVSWSLENIFSSRICRLWKWNCGIFTFTCRMSFQELKYDWSGNSAQKRVRSNASKRLGIRIEKDNWLLLWGNEDSCRICQTRDKCKWWPNVFPLFRQGLEKVRKKSKVQTAKPVEYRHNRLERYWRFEWNKKYYYGYNFASVEPSEFVHVDRWTTWHQ